MKCHVKHQNNGSQQRSNAQVSSNIYKLTKNQGVKIFCPQQMFVNRFQKVLSFWSKVPLREQLPLFLVRCLFTNGVIKIIRLYLIPVARLIILVLEQNLCQVSFLCKHQRSLKRLPQQLRPMGKLTHPNTSKYFYSRKSDFSST